MDKKEWQIVNIVAIQLGEIISIFVETVGKLGELIRGKRAS